MSGLRIREILLVIGSKQANKNINNNNTNLNFYEKGFQIYLKVDDYNAKVIKSLTLSNINIFK